MYVIISPLTPGKLENAALEMISIESWYVCMYVYIHHTTPCMK